MIHDFHVKENDVIMIPNGIDIKRFVQTIDDKRQVKTKLGLGDGPVIGIVARKIPNAQLLIVGEGKIEEDLVNLCKKLEIEKNVFFLSSVTDIIQVLGAMDLFVLPSLQEGLGLSLMEAMASGLAVIGSDVGGIKSLIKHGYTGILVKPADSRELSNAILELLLDQDWAMILGNNARMFIAQNFSQEKMVLETERVYLECLNAKY